MPRRSIKPVVVGGVAPEHAKAVEAAARARAAWLDAQRANAPRAVEFDTRTPSSGAVEALHIINDSL